ncbi:acetyl-CoA biotin carboxyl carrier [Haematococcus lacustris]
MQTSIHRRACKPGCGSSSAPRVARANPRPVLRSVADDLASANGAAAHAPVIDFDELSDIIRMVHDTDIIELDLKSKKFNLSLKKKEALQVEQVVQYVQQQPAATMAAPAPASQPASPAPPAAAAAPAPAPAPMTPSVQKIEGIELTSPMAGTFYKAAAPGEAPFVKAGDKVKKGQVVGIVEAMKLMNEIEAEFSGEVVKVLLENGSPVTVGTPIILIRP